ncbi:zinc ribbon domain-containing protein [Halobacteriovorax sp. HLS]|uniref:zinc ribbon domain-containing protein n=1 Tax=Halobacteriovorax sp. HLS TaxID=2234000 RepID=UPI000FDA87DD|nr:hypothetical protein [Halobacteriovorax sp. HLS]
MEHYRQLIEIQSLHDNISKHKEKIQSELSRLDFVSKQRDKKISELSSIKKRQDEIHSLINSSEKDLFKHETELEKAKSHLDLAQSASQIQALEKEIEFQTPLVNSLQEKILEFMQESEDLEVQVIEFEQFIDGSLNTLKELEVEVQTANKMEEKEINNYNERISLLISALDPSLQNIYNSTLSRTKDSKALSFLRARQCSACGTEAPSVQVSEIENGRSTELCSGCNRILIPATINAL